MSDLVVKSDHQVKKSLQVFMRALAPKVLVVATVDLINEQPVMWRCFVDAVPGQDHSEEWGDVIKQGTSVCRDLAEAFFPEYKQVKYRS